MRRTLHCDGEGAPFREFQTGNRSGVPIPFLSDLLCDPHLNNGKRLGPKCASPRGSSGRPTYPGPVPGSSALRRAGAPRKLSVGQVAPFAFLHFLLS